MYRLLLGKVRQTHWLNYVTPKDQFWAKRMLFFLFFTKKICTTESNLYSCMKQLSLQQIFNVKLFVSGCDVRLLLVLPSSEISLLMPVGYTAATLTEYGVSGSSFCRMTLVFFPPTCVCSQETCRQWDSCSHRRNTVVYRSLVTGGWLMKKNATNGKHKWEKHLLPAVK